MHMPLAKRGTFNCFSLHCTVTKATANACDLNVICLGIRGSACGAKKIVIKREIEAALGKFHAHGKQCQVSANSTGNHLQKSGKFLPAAKKHVLTDSVDMSSAWRRLEGYCCVILMLLVASLANTR